MNFIALTTAFSLTLVSLHVLRPVAMRVGLLDTPGGRKTHVRATPLVGGLGIFLGTLFATAVIPGLLASFAPLLSLAALILFIGAIDDARDLNAGLRMTGHALVALCMAVVAGIELQSLGDLLGNGAVRPGILVIPLTVFASVGVINAINMSDGIDGLSGGLVITSLAFIGVVSFTAGNGITTAFIVILICSLLAFLALNFRVPWKKQALVYMGDAGSTTLGFILAWLLIAGSQGPEPAFPPVYALWFLAVPLMDTVNLLIKRPLQGHSPFRPGHDHLHHQLIRLGMSVQQVVALCVSAALLFGAVGLAGYYLGATDRTMFLGFLALFGIYFVCSSKIATEPEPAQPV